MKACVVVLCLLVPAALQAQQYLEVSGRTVTFDLKAGARAAWDTRVSAISPRAADRESKCASIGCRVSGQTIRTFAESAVPSGCRLVLYSVKGQAVVNTPFLPNAVMVLPQRLAVGCYLMRVQTAASVLFTSQIPVTR